MQDARGEMRKHLQGRDWPLRNVYRLPALNYDVIVLLSLTLILMK